MVRVSGRYPRSSPKASEKRNLSSTALRPRRPFLLSWADLSFADSTRSEVLSAFQLNVLSLLYTSASIAVGGIAADPSADIVASLIPRAGDDARFGILNNGAGDVQLGRVTGAGQVLL